MIPDARCRAALGPGAERSRCAGVPPEGVGDRRAPHDVDLPERARSERIARVMDPPFEVLRSVGVDRFVDTAMHGAIRLVGVVGQDVERDMGHKLGNLSVWVADSATRTELGEPLLPPES
jgi:hypothetical protein